MKKILFALCALLVFASSANAECIKKNYNVNHFSGISAGKVFDITVEKADSCALSITLDKEYAQYLSVVIKNDILYISFKNIRNMPKKMRNVSNCSMIVNIKMPELKTLNLSGASKFRCSDDFSLGMGKFLANISGASKVESLNVSAVSAELYVSGASDFEINGSFGETEIEVSGAANAIFNIDSRDLEASNSGSSYSRFRGEYEVSNIEVSGASKTVMSGTTNHLKVECSGASAFNSVEMGCKIANVEATGASVVKLSVDKQINAELTGASVCTYYAPNSIIVYEEVSRACRLKRESPK